MSNSIKKILIVGGGSAGWIAAAYLNRFIDPAMCRITLVESPAIGTVGVGEATVPPLVSLLRLLGVEEADFMRACHATYKLGIKFVGWNDGATDRPDAQAVVWHPFGPVGAPLASGLPLFHHWLRERRAGHDAGSYTSYSLQALLGDADRAPRTLEAPSIITRHGAYAYHLDAQAFADYLRRLAVRRGVRHVSDEVRTVHVDQNGFLRWVETAQNGRLEADLFLDCSGFAGLLIEQTLRDPYLDWSQYLFCDRAAVLPTQRAAGAPLPSYTEATALSAGWAWRIPLSHRNGNGYVYSSRFVSDEDAARELAVHAGVDPDGTAPRLLRFRVGRRANFWVKNCVSVGLAGGFLEPLESTGLALVQKGVELLLDHFPDAGFEPELVARYNAKLGTEFEQVRDFIILHYALAGRVDEGFWRANRRVAVPDAVVRTLQYYFRTGMVDWEGERLFRDPSFYSIATGFGCLPRTEHPMAAMHDAQRVRRELAGIKAQNAALAQTLPMHAELIRQLNAAPAGPGAPA